jgi:WD40 repeat protein
MNSNKGLPKKYGGFFSMRFALFMIAFILQSCSSTTAASPTKIVYQFTPTSEPKSVTPNNTPKATPPFSDNEEIGHVEESLVSINTLPSGSYIVYCSFNELDDNYGNSLFVMDHNGDVYGMLADDACRSSISLDDTLLVFDRRDWSRMDYYLIIFELETGNERVVPNSLGCSEGSFGPSNDRIVTACKNNIFVIELVSGSKRMIDDCEARGGACGSPVWSPDGRYIIYDYLQSFSPNSGVFLLDTDCIESLTDCSPSRIASPNFGFYSWSPDSSVVASLAEEGAITFFEIPSGKTQKLILPVTASARGIAFSTNGRELAITLEGDQKESYRIFLFNLEDGEAKYIGDSTYHKGVMFWLDRP